LSVLPTATRPIPSNEDARGSGPSSVSPASAVRLEVRSLAGLERRDRFDDVSRRFRRPIRLRVEGHPQGTALRVHEMVGQAAPIWVISSASARETEPDDLGRDVRPGGSRPIRPRPRRAPREHLDEQSAAPRVVDRRSERPSCGATPRAARNAGRADRLGRRSLAGLRRRSPGHEAVLGEQDEPGQAARARLRRASRRKRTMYHQDASEPKHSAAKPALDAQTSAPIASGRVVDVRVRDEGRAARLRSRRGIEGSTGSERGNATMSSSDISSLSSQGDDSCRRRPVNPVVAIGREVRCPSPHPERVPLLAGVIDLDTFTRCSRRRSWRTERRSRGGSSARRGARSSPDADAAQLSRHAGAFPSARAAAVRARSRSLRTPGSDRPRRRGRPRTFAQSGRTSVLKASCKHTVRSEDVARGLGELRARLGRRAALRIRHLEVEDALDDRLDAVLHVVR